MELKLQDFKRHIFCVCETKYFPVTVSLGPHLDQAQSWFIQVFYISKKEPADKNSIILDIKTDIIRGLDFVTDVIIAFAAKNKMDLIMMGTKGTSGLRRFLIGSIAQGVVYHANCSFLLVGSGLFVQHYVKS